MAVALDTELDLPDVSCSMANALEKTNEARIAMTANFLVAVKSKIDIFITKLLVWESLGAVAVRPFFIKVRAKDVSRCKSISSEISGSLTLFVSHSI